MKIGIAAAIVFAFVAGRTVAQDLIEAPEVQTIDSLRRGTFATIEAETIRYRDNDEILVRDATGRIEIFLGSGAISPPLAVGESATITGWVDDDFFAIRREIYATRIVREDGSVVDLAGRSNSEW